MESLTRKQCNSFPVVLKCLEKFQYLPREKERDMRSSWCTVNFVLVTTVNVTLNRSWPISSHLDPSSAYVLHYFWAGFLFKTHQSKIEEIVHLSVCSRRRVPKIAGCSLYGTQPFALFPVFRHLQYFSNKHPS